MGRLAIIGGSGFAQLPGLSVESAAPVATRWGETAAPLVTGTYAGCPVLFLARHGSDHALPPHRVNYRANIAALVDAGATGIVGLGAVGGIAADCGPGVLAVPDQLIDYTHGRAGTFHEGGIDGVVHVDMTWPFDPALRAALLAAAGRAGVAVRNGGTCAVTQGPRLETAAEVRRLGRDGCDLVGMTALPEAALARERGVPYATLAFVVNRAAGIDPAPITLAAIAEQIEYCRAAVQRVLAALLEDAG